MKDQPGHDLTVAEIGEVFPFELAVQGLAPGDDLPLVVMDDLFLQHPLGGHGVYPFRSDMVSQHEFLGMGVEIDLARQVGFGEFSDIMGQEDQGATRGICPTR